MKNFPMRVQIVNTGEIVLVKKLEDFPIGVACTCLGPVQKQNVFRSAKHLAVAYSVLDSWGRPKTDDEYKEMLQDLKNAMK